MERSKAPSHDGNSGNKNGMDLQVDLRDMWLHVAANWPIMMVGTLAAMSFCGIYTFFFEDPIYRTSVTVKISSQPSLPGVGSLFEVMGGGGSGEAAGSKLQSQIDYFHSPDFTELVVDRLAKEPEVFRRIMEENSDVHLSATEMALLKQGKALPDRRKASLARLLFVNLNLVQDSYGSSLSLYADSPDPQLSFRMADAASQVLIEENYQKVLSKANKSREFLSFQTTDLRRQLKKLESDLVAFQHKNHLLSEQDVQSSTYQVYLRNRERIEEIRRQLAANAKLQSNLTHDLNGLRNHMTDPKMPMSNLYLSQLQHRMNILQYQKALVSTADGTKVNAAELKAMNDEMETVSKEYRHALQLSDSGRPVGMSSFDYYQSLERNKMDLKQAYNRLDSELRVLSTDFTGQQAKVKELPEVLQNLAVLRRNIDVTSQLYLASKKKFQEVQFMTAETVNDLSILVRPREPLVPSGIPVYRMFIFAFFVGTFLGWLMILLRDILIHTVRGKRDFEDCGVEFLSGVSTFDVEAHQRGVAANSLNGKVISTIRREFQSLVSKTPPVMVLEKWPDSHNADNFRSLRMKLLGLLSDGDAQGRDVHGKMIMVSGPSAGCGKSFVAANLASAMAKANLKTLLVDMNLRNPALYRFFPEIAAKGGLETLEGGAQDIRNLIIKASPSLDVLMGTKMAGHAPDLLESKALRICLEEMRETYDLIIMDCPAILNTIDSSLITAFADAVIMVAGYQKTFTEDVKMAVDSLHNTGNKPIYGVLNFIDPKVSQRAS